MVCGAELSTNSDSGGAVSGLADRAPYPLVAVRTSRATGSVNSPLESIASSVSVMVCSKAVLCSPRSR